MTENVNPETTVPAKKLARTRHYISVLSPGILASVAVVVGVITTSAAIRGYKDGVNVNAFETDPTSK